LKYEKDINEERAKEIDCLKNELEKFKKQKIEDDEIKKNYEAK